MRIIRGATRRVYISIIKPILFTRHPDDVHTGLIQLGKCVQKLPVVFHLPRLWSYQSPKLTQRVFGLDIRNPVGLSAGFDKDIELAPLMSSVGFGFMTGGSITAKECAGNPKPWFHRLPHSRALVVHAGLPNKGVKAVTNRIAHYPERLFRDMPLAVSVAKTNTIQSATDNEAIIDYCESLQVLNSHHVGQWYEINISCPNTYGGEPFTTPARLRKLLDAIDALNIDRPVVIKMPIDKSWKEFRSLLEVIVSHKVDGVAIGNLSHSRQEVDARDGLTQAVKGNISGLPTRRLSTDLIRHTYAAYGNRLIIIGIGGIFSAADAYEKIRAGASLVALVTGMIFEGPQLIGEINAGLEKYLRQDGFSSISDAVGVDVQKSV